MRFKTTYRVRMFASVCKIKFNLSRVVKNISSLPAIRLKRLFISYSIAIIQ